MSAKRRPRADNQRAVNAATEGEVLHAATPQGSGSLELSAVERQLDADYDWCLHDPEVQRMYRGKVVAAHKRRIWGAGKSHGAATRAALRRPGCPPRQELAKVYIQGTPLGADSP